jgi:hypothetical protein
VAGSVVVLVIIAGQHDHHRQPDIDVPDENPKRIQRESHQITHRRPPFSVIVIQSHLGPICGVKLAH